VSAEPNTSIARPARLGSAGPAEGRRGQWMAVQDAAGLSERSQGRGRTDRRSLDSAHQ
jgi:hypothetical protein